MKCRLSLFVWLVAFASQAFPEEVKQQTQTTRSAAAVPDYSVLAPFRDALLEFKAAAEIGMNLNDFHQKLQVAAGEKAKAEARINELPQSFQQVMSRYSCYSTVMDKYRTIRAAMEINQVSEGYRAKTEQLLRKMVKDDETLEAYKRQLVKHDSDKERSYADIQSRLKFASVLLSKCATDDWKSYVSADAVSNPRP